MPRSLILVALLCLFLPASLSAQETLGLHIIGLTSAERDSISLHHPGPEGLHLAYACVPAGILVFTSGQSGRSLADLRSQAIQGISTFIPPQRIDTAELTLQAARSACQAAREQ